MDAEVLDWTTPESLAELGAVAGRPGFWRWQELVRATGGCAEPVHLVGESRRVDPVTGEVLSRYCSSNEPGGRLLVACRNRRASRCPACAEVYRADTYQLTRAGLAGGKNVPTTVASHPRVFVTLTATGFGSVHHRVVDPAGRVARCHPRGGCRRRHRPDDACLGQAIDPDRYDYQGAVIWNALAGVLWHRTVTLIVRRLAASLGLSETEFRRAARLSYSKVAEFQARGLVHFHAILRLDGPDGPAHAPSEALSVSVLIEAVETAARQARVASPQSQQRWVRWGAQIDTQPITADEAGAEGEVTDQQVAGYVAKYATKAAETTGTLDRPVACWHCQGAGQLSGRRCRRCEGHGTHLELAELRVNPHAKAMIAAAWELGGQPELAELRLRPWAHMLGFRGHFSTRSRRYSTTLQCLRQARQDWRNRPLHAPPTDGLADPTRQGAATDAGPEPDEDTVLVIGQWQYAGRGHSPGEAAFARTIAEDIAENRRIVRYLRDLDWEAA